MAGEKTLFNIRDFGAKGDGVADDTLAISRAISAAAQVCGTVAVPPGKYITGRQQLYPNICLKADKAWSYNATGSAAFILRDGDTDCMLDITEAYGVSIYGLVLDGRRLGKNIHGVMLGKKDNGSREDTPTFDGCLITSFSGDGLHLDRGWCFQIRHCQISSNQGSGLWMHAWDGFILDNWFSANGNYGIYCTEYNNNSAHTLTANRIECNNRGGIRLDNGDKWNITGNYFDWNGGPSLDFGDHEYTGHCAITGNLFNRSGVFEWGDSPQGYQSSHIWCRKVNNLTITGNSFLSGRGHDGAGARAPEYVAVFQNCTQIIFSANSTDSDSTVWENCTKTVSLNNV